MGNRSSPTLILARICGAKARLRRRRPLQTTRTAVVMRLSSAGTIFIFFLGPLSSDARAQYYLGAQAGWTGLPYQTDAIDGLGPIPVKFNAGYNVGARGGYQLAQWRFEEEYSYRRNNVAEYGVTNDITNRVSGNRHTHSIMTNVIYDFATGWLIMPHIGVGIGAMDVFDGLKIPSGGLVFNDSSWQFGYQAIVGLRYDINPVLAVDLDYRYLATTESTFRIPNTNVHYRTGANTNNFVASLTYRLGPLPPDPPSNLGPPAP
jgi:opacity protein-like surface antigen